jgi:hypothetical protein
MDGEWVDAWPPFWVEARGETTTLLVRVVVSVPSEAQSWQARRDARVSAGYDERRNRLTVGVSGVRSVYRVRVQVPGLAVDTGVSHRHGPGEEAVIDRYL